MARRRFFVKEVRRGSAELEGEEAQHLSRVLRAGPGQQFEISDNQSVYLAEIESVRKDKVVFRLVSGIEAREPAVRLTLFASLIRFERFEWLLEKATELGVESIVPVAAARSEKGLEQAAMKRLERWRKIALEASQQARRDRLPEIRPVARYADAVRTGKGYAYFLEEDPAAPPVLSALPEPARRRPSDAVSLLVGPEGGWTDAERALAREAGWAAVSLGRNVLRTETAALAALAVVGSAWRS